MNFSIKYMNVYVCACVCKTFSQFVYYLIIIIPLTGHLYIGGSSYLVIS